MEEQNQLGVVIITPDKSYPRIAADSVSVVAGSGRLEILPGHAEYLGEVAVSALEISSGGKIRRYAVGGGAMHINNAENTVYLILNSIEAADEIDPARALVEKTRAEKKLRGELSAKEHVKAELSLRKALNRLSVKGNKGV